MATNKQDQKGTPRTRGDLDVAENKGLGIAGGEDDKITDWPASTREMAEIMQTLQEILAVQKSIDEKVSSMAAKLSRPHDDNVQAAISQLLDESGPRGAVFCKNYHWYAVFMTLNKWLGYNLLPLAFANQLRLWGFIGEGEKKKVIDGLRYAKDELGDPLALPRSAWLAKADTFVGEKRTLARLAFSLLEWLGYDRARLERMARSEAELRRP